MSRPPTDYEQAQYIAQRYQCGNCGPLSRLAVRWYGGRDACWCPRCKRTEGFTRKVSLMAQWKADPDSVPIEIANVFERKCGMKPMTGQELTVANENTMLARIKTARWLKNVSAEDQHSLAQLSNLYGFDPLMQELIIYEGKPYITVAGLIRMAHRQKLFAGVEDRPMTEGERKQYGYTAPLCWIAKVYRKDWHVPAVGTGKADPEKPYRDNFIEKHHPEWMARSRALRQALKLAFPHFLPFEQMDSAEERGIDPETGEILEGQVFEVPGIIHDEEGIPHFAEPTSADVRTEQPKAEPKASANATGQPGARIVHESAPMPEGHLCAECVRLGEPSTITEKLKGQRLWTPDRIANQTITLYGEKLCWNHWNERFDANKQDAEQAILPKGKPHIVYEPIDDQEEGFASPGPRAADLPLDLSAAPIPEADAGAGHRQDAMERLQKAVAAKGYTWDIFAAQFKQKRDVTVESLGLDGLNALIAEVQPMKPAASRAARQ